MFGRSRTPAVPSWPPPPPLQVEITADQVLLIEEIMQARAVCQSDVGHYEPSSRLPRALYERIGEASATTPPEQVRIHLDAEEIAEIERAVKGVRSNHTRDGWRQCHRAAHEVLLRRADVLMRRLYIALGHARAVRDQPAAMPRATPSLPPGHA